MVNGSLPASWEWSTLGEATQINPRDVSLRTLPDETTVTFLPMAAVDAWQGVIAEPEIRSLKSVRKGFTAFAEGDVLFAKITPSMENGKAAIAQKLENRIGFGSTEFHVFRPKDSVIARWIFHFVRQESFRKDAKAHFAGTAGQLRVPAGFLTDYPIPVPPLSEQERIVAKIEELFTQLDAGTSALEKVQAGLRRYKASVLKSAFEARLVEKKEVERSKNRETSEKLLQHLDKSPIVDNTVSTLPIDWRWVKIKDFAFVTKLAGFEYTKYVKYKETGDIPVIRAQNVSKEDGFRERNFVYVEKDLMKQLTRSGLHGGEVLMVFVGAGLGNVGIVPDGKDFFLGPNVALIRGDETMVYNKYLYHFLQSDLGKKHVQSFSKSTAQGSISMGNIRDVTVPFPPLEEQRRIVAEVERRLSVAREVESAVGKALVRAGRWRQAVLKHAFEGKL